MKRTVGSRVKESLKPRAYKQSEGYAPWMTHGALPDGVPLEE